MLANSKLCLSYTRVNKVHLQGRLCTTK